MSGYDGHPCYGAGYTDGHDAGRIEGHEDGVSAGYNAALTATADDLEAMAERRITWADHCRRAMRHVPDPYEWADVSARYVREARVLRRAARLIRRRVSEVDLDSGAGGTR